MAMNDGGGLADATLDLLHVVEFAMDGHPCEVIVTVETTSCTTYRPPRRMRANPHDGTTVQLRDVHLCGRPLRLVAKGVLTLVAAQIPWRRMRRTTWSRSALWSARLAAFQSFRYP